MQLLIVTAAWLLLGICACRPGSLSVGRPPLLPHSGTSALGPFRGVNRAQVEKELLIQFKARSTGTDTLQLRAEYVAASDLAANALADWARRLEPSTISNEDLAAPIHTQITVIPPADYRPSVAVSWGSLWGVTLVSPPSVLSEADIKRWASLVARLALDERWRLITYSVGRPAAPLP
jgi:hypothetical protein